MPPVNILQTCLYISKNFGDNSINNLDIFQVPIFNRLPLYDENLSLSGFEISCFFFVKQSLVL